MATAVTITDNENTNETNAIIFTAGGDVDGGDIGLESDGDLTYNPSSGLLSATAVTATGAVNTGALTSTGNISFDGGSFVFNESGADKDFRIEGDANANLFVADASADKIGIGIAVPEASLHVCTTTGGAAPHANHDELVLENWGNHAGMTLISGTDYSGYIAFSDNEQNRGTIEYSQWANAMMFYTNTVERLRMNNAGAVYIGDSANGNMTIGLTINQAANDNQALALKSSDVGVGTGTTWDGTIEEDTYGSMGKVAAATGGLLIRGFSEGTIDASIQGVRIYGIANTGQATKSISGVGIVTIDVAEHDDAGGLSNMTADVNCFSVRRRISSGLRAAFLVDEDGDLFCDSGTSTTAVTVYDAYDDVALIHAYDRACNPSDAITTEHRAWLKYNEQKLVEVGVLGDTLANGGLTCVTKLQQLQNGAIRQIGARQLDIIDQLNERDERIAALENKIKRLEMN